MKLNNKRERPAGQSRRKETAPKKLRDRTPRMERKRREALRQIRESGLRAPEGTGRKSGVLSRIGFDADYFAGALTQIVAALLAVCAVFYFAYHTAAVFSSEVSVSDVYTVSEDISVPGTAYILREERVLTSGSDGYLLPAVAEGERVGKGEAVCRFYTADYSGTAARISQIDGEIAMLNRCRGNGAASVGVLDSLAAVRSRYAGILRSSAAGDWQSVCEQSESFRESLDRCAFLNGGETVFSARLEELKNEKKKAQAALGSPIATVKAPVPGYYYPWTDGYEGQMTAALCTGFTEDTYNSLVSMTPQAAGNACGKLALSAAWYLAVRCDGFALQDLAAGDSCPIGFPGSGDLVLSMKLVTSVRTDTGYVLLFTSDELPAGFGFERCQEVVLSAGTVTGYRIPNTALHTLDGMTGVYVRHGRYVYFRRISVISEGEGYCVAEPYETAEPGPPATYRVSAYDMRGAVNDYASVYRFGFRSGANPVRSGYLDAVADGKQSIAGILTMRRGNRGIPVPYGSEYLYYYCLNGTETLILTGKDLYHGKVLG